jgi:hypothetical protein
MPEPVQGRFGRWALRLARVAIGFTLALLLLAGLALAYLRWSGVPGFLRDQIENRLRASGWNVRFGKLRLHGRVLIGEQVSITSAGSGLRSALEVDRAELTLRQNIWQAGVLMPSHVRMVNGRLALHDAMSNAPPRQLNADQIQAELNFPGNDQLQIERFTGRFLGLDFNVRSSITNASALRRWQRPTGQGARLDWPGLLEAWARRLESVRLTQPATLDLNLSGDGKAPASLRAELRLQAAQMASSLGRLDNVDLRASATPSDPSAEACDWQIDARFRRVAALQFEGTDAHWSARGSLAVTNSYLQRLATTVQVSSIRSPWVTNGPSVLVVEVDATPGGAWRTELNLQLSQLSSAWAQSATNTLTIDWTHDGLDWMAGSGEWKLDAGPVRTSWGQVQQIRLFGSATPALAYGQWHPADETWGYWSKLAPFNLDWEAQVENVDSPKLRLDRLACAGQWRAPELLVQRLQAELYDGRLESAASLDVVTRDLRARSVFDFDITQLSAFLPAEAQQFVSQIKWSQPPEVAVDARVILPEWTNEHPRWADDVLLTLELAGQLSATNASIRGLPLSYVRSSFSLTNATWRLPDLFIRRPDGETSFQSEFNTRTHEFHCALDGGIDPKALSPLLTEPVARQALNLFTFTGRPVIHGKAHGRWDDVERLVFQGQVVATNFTFKGETCDLLSANLHFTNALLHFSDVLIQHGTQEIRAPLGAYDFPKRVVYVTNALSTMDPDLVVRVIGPKVRAAIEPYHFLVPPTVVVNGRVPTVDENDADLHFKVQGDKFKYWKINASNVRGDVFWQGQYLNVTNIQATVYGGALTWHGDFDFTAPVGAQIKMDGYVRNADLHELMVDLGNPTNQLAGSLTGRVNISDANSEDWWSWQGAGWVRLRDGYLWDIPIFGMFSPVLNTIVPGLGRSPVSSGNASFTIDRSVLKTKNLELRSPALRLRYNGSVDIKGGVDARVQAEVLRDAWGVGRLLSAAFWPITKAFEYRIHGTVNQPKSEPLYIPKLLLWPLHPFRNARQFFEGARPEQPEPDHDTEAEPVEK